TAFLFAVMGMAGAGCGDDTGGTGGTGGSGGSGGTGGTGGQHDAKVIDAAVDAPAIDSGGADSSTIPADCVTYCTCMVGTCTDVGGTNLVPGGTMDACESMCATQTNWDLACRNTHCGYARDMHLPMPHCFHAVGMMGVCTNH